MSSTSCALAEGCNKQIAQIVQACQVQLHSTFGFVVHYANSAEFMMVCQLVFDGGVATAPCKPFENRSSASREEH